MVRAISGISHCSSTNIVDKPTNTQNSTQCSKVGKDRLRNDLSTARSNTTGVKCDKVEVVVVSSKQFDQPQGRSTKLTAERIKPVAKTPSSVPSLAMKIMNVAALGCLVVGAITASQESDELGQRAIGIVTATTASALVLASSVLDKTKAKYVKLVLAVAGFGSALFLVNQSVQKVHALREAESHGLSGPPIPDLSSNVDSGSGRTGPLSEANPLDSPINALFRLDAFNVLKGVCINDEEGEHKGKKFSLNPNTDSLYNIKTFEERYQNDVTICGKDPFENPAEKNTNESVTPRYGCTPEPKQKMSLIECYLADRHSENPLRRVRASYSACNGTTGVTADDANENGKLITKIDDMRVEVEKASDKLLYGAYASSNRLLERDGYSDACRPYLNEYNAHLQREFDINMSKEDIRNENSWISVATKVAKGAFSGVFAKIANKAKALVG